MLSRAGTTADDQRADRPESRSTRGRVSQHLTCSLDSNGIQREEWRNLFVSPWGQWCSSVWFWQSPSFCVAAFHFKKGALTACTLFWSIIWAQGTGAASFSQVMEVHLWTISWTAELIFTVINNYVTIITTSAKFNMKTGWGTRLHSRAECRKQSDKDT